MKDDSNLFITGNLVFWLILLVLIFLLAPLFRHRVYDDEERLARWLEKFRESRDSVTVVKTDTSRVIKPDSVKVNWYVAHFSWIDFDGRNHELAFRFDRAEYDRAVRVRETAVFESPELLYYQLLEASKVPLDSMTRAMMRDIRQKGLSGLDLLNYVATAIQTPKYTLITDIKACPGRAYGSDWVDDCSPRMDGMGCCNFVVPWGVFSPAEFIVQKTGDCDTKSLIAYAILKRMGFDVAVIHGDVENGGRHAMLGVANFKPEIISKYVTRGAGGKIYYPWEVTSFYPHNRLGNMMMWNTWNNWEVRIN